MTAVTKPSLESLQGVAAYSYEKLVEVFVEQGMTELEAVEWIDFNIAGAYVGEYTPIIIYQELLYDFEEDEGLCY